MSRTVRMKVITRLQDNGDGGYTMYVYNDVDELIADHPKFEVYNGDKPKGERFSHRKPTDEERTKILDGDDEYENGYIGGDFIEVEIDDDGNVRLSKSLSFHAGQ